MSCSRCQAASGKKLPLHHWKAFGALHAESGLAEEQYLAAGVLLAGTAGCCWGPSWPGCCALLPVAMPGCRGGSRLAGGWAVQGAALPGRLPAGSATAAGSSSSGRGRLGGRPTLPFG